MSSRPDHVKGPPLQAAWPVTEVVADRLVTETCHPLDAGLQNVDANEPGGARREPCVQQLKRSILSRSSATQPTSSTRRREPLLQ